MSSTILERMFLEHDNRPLLNGSCQEEAASLSLKVNDTSGKMTCACSCAKAH